MPFKRPNVAIHEIFMLYSIMKNNGSRCYSVIQLCRPSDIQEESKLLHCKIARARTNLG